MNGAARVLAFAVGCAALFAVALGVGSVVGPINTEPAEADHGGGMGGDGGSDDMDDMAGMDDMGTDHGVGGLEAAAGGYSLALTSAGLEAGRQPLTFAVTGPDGARVTAYDEQHERDLHLVVVRRDLTGFQHVHPDLDPTTGEWTTDVDLDPGAWRVLADFVPAGGDKLVLGADLLVAGDFEPQPLGGDVVVAQADGYDVRLDRTDDADGGSLLTATVTRDGAPVTDLEPYLGAYGHLVALREGDLGYLHVHPEEGAPGPEIAFGTEFPSAGRYRLFLQFQHAGTVHTVAFTTTVETAEDHDEH
ncbi:hypothetical protein [Nocardioides halotolerans]|uniref:hypothetical protein n=1 Tax=Nocardioides halotolerans TaxID=433660 RepID=UPI0004063062|nr:hypothetical protein [Nocardioides halotolerans]